MTYSKLRTRLHAAERRAVDAERTVREQDKVLTELGEEVDTLTGALRSAVMCLRAGRGLSRSVDPGAEPMELALEIERAFGGVN